MWMRPRERGMVEMILRLASVRDMSLERLSEPQTYEELTLMGEEQPTLNLTNDSIVPDPLLTTYADEQE